MVDTSLLPAYNSPEGRALSAETPRDAPLGSGDEQVWLKPSNRGGGYTVGWKDGAHMHQVHGLTPDTALSMSKMMLAGMQENP